MTDVKYRPDEWEKAKKALEELSESSGWVNSKNKIVGYIEDIHENMEEAGNDIRNLDSDGVISFNYEDTTGKFRELLEDFGVLQDFTDKVGDAVDRAIDQPFYKDMDAFAIAMRDLSIENYTTKNTIGATEVKVTYTGGYGPDAYKTTERKKDTINMIDILNGNNFYAAKMKVDFDRFKQEHPDEKFSFEDYQSAALNTRAFQYESIEDNQKKKEFWRDIIIGIGLIVGTVAAIACPPAAPAILALGASYGALELGSAVSGKDWMTGRELDTGERWLRGAFSLLDIVPGVKGIHAFTKASRGVPEAILKVAKQSAINLQTGMKVGKQSVQAIMKTAAEKAAGRVRAVKAAVKDAIGTTMSNLEPKMLKVAEKMDVAITSAAIKLEKFVPIRELSLADGGKVAATNNHAVQKITKNVLDKFEGKLNLRSGTPRTVLHASDEVIDVSYGEHIVRGRWGKKSLQPNVRYTTEDGYRYVTDSKGRIVTVEADNLVLKQARRNLSAQRKVGEEYRLIDDDGGHLIGTQFHGPGDIDNLVAQNRQINRSGGKWYEMETEWANALKEEPPKKVSVNIEAVYSGDSLRPDSFKVKYQIEGERKVIKEILNKAGG